MFPGARVLHGLAAHSDHLPIILSTSHERRPSRKKIFQFEAMWSEDDACEGVVADSWNGRTDGMPTPNIIHRIGVCSQRLAD